MDLETVGGPGFKRYFVEGEQRRRNERMGAGVVKRCEVESGVYKESLSLESGSVSPSVVFTTRVT